MNVPAGQAVQLVAPAALENVPGLQATGVPIPAGQYWPAAAEHVEGGPGRLQTVAPVVLVLCPAGQALQEAAPPDGWKKPMAQAWQEDAPDAL